MALGETFYNKVGLSALTNNITDVLKYSIYLAVLVHHRKYRKLLMRNILSILKHKLFHW